MAFRLNIAGRVPSFANWTEPHVPIVTRAKDAIRPRKKTDGGEFFADVHDIATDVPADYGAGFPVVLLVLTTDVEQDSATDEEPEPEPQARQYDVDDAPECPECQRGRGSSLGFLGGVLWFRCRQCGMEYNMQGV